MADESEIQEAASDAGKTSGQVIGASEAGGGKKYNLIDDLFSGGNKLLTLPGSSLVINDDTRRLLALFADGRFLVVESHKFDGRVLSFEVLARKKHLNISKPTYVSQNEINAVYAYGERAQPMSDIEGDEDLDQLQMQKDFVNVIARAAAVKVSDVHVVVADSTQIMFRVNGMMQTVMEYNKDWANLLSAPLSLRQTFPTQTMRKTSFRAPRNWDQHRCAAPKAN